MKKITAILLCLTMVLGLSVSVFAAVPGPDTGNVNVKILGTDAIVYSVTVNWDNLTDYEYNLGAWNPSNLEYDTGTGWVDNSKNVIVTNKSNTAVTYDAKFSNDSTTCDTVNGVTATVTNNTKTLNTAVGTPSGTSETLPVQVNGAPNVLTNYKVDTLTISFS